MNIKNIGTKKEYEYEVEVIGEHLWISDGSGLRWEYVLKDSIE